MNAPPCRRGVTLIEVLIATAILAMATAAAIPLVHGVTSTIRSTPSSRAGVADLARLADTVVGTPGKFGISAGASLPSTVQWPEGRARDAVTISVLQSGEEQRQLSRASLHPEVGAGRNAVATGAWILFRDGDRFAIRWLDVPVKVSR